MREAVDLRQAKPAALVHVLGGEEGIEHLGQQVGRDARLRCRLTARATNSPSDAGCGLAARPGDVLGRQRHRSRRSAWRRARSARGSRARARARWDRPSPARVGRRRDRQPRRRPSELVSMIRTPARRSRQRQHHRIEALPAREGEQLARERRAALRGKLDGVERRRTRWDRRRACLLHQLGLAADHHQRLLKSWATPPVSWPSASIFCAWARCAWRFLQRELGLAAFGDVAGDLGEADQLAVVVADRGR